MLYSGERLQDHLSDGPMVYSYLEINRAIHHIHSHGAAFS